MATFNENVKINEKLNVEKDFSVTQGANVSTSGTVSDLANTGSSFFTLSAATTLESIVAADSGKELVLTNTNSVSMIVKNQTGSTAANRIITGTGTDITVAAGASLLLKYDSAASRWRVVGAAGSGVTGPGTSVDSEVALFNGTTGGVIKRASGTGYVKVTSGVFQTPSPNVPARDVLGDTTGTSVPTGYIGEKISFSSASGIAINSAPTIIGDGSTTGVATLTPGVYMVFANGIYIASDSTTYIPIELYSIGGTATVSNTGNLQASPVSDDSSTLVYGYQRIAYVLVTSTTLIGVRAAAVSGGTASGASVSSSSFAIRIA